MVQVQINCFRSLKIAKSCDVTSPDNVTDQFSELGREKPQDLPGDVNDDAGDDRAGERVGLAVAGELRKK